MKKIISLLLIMVVAIGLYLYSVYKRYDHFKTTAYEVNDTVNIEKGESWRKVRLKLKKKAIIRNGEFLNRNFFGFLIKEMAVEKQLKTGEFHFEGKLSPVQVINQIVKGKVKMYSFTIPEGYNMYDANEVFKKLDWIEGNESFLNLCKSGKLLRKVGGQDLKSCEGLLFPSTYKFERGVSLESILTHMGNQMFAVLEKYSKEISKSGFSSYEVLKLASVIEKETGVRDEQPLIASVFLNRLKRGMKLQSDPTVIYGMLPNFDGNIRKKDLLTDHPYSTYTRKGLPKTPIAFPGENAIKSVLYPKNGSYLYFVSTNNGYHYFSKSLKEHNAAVDHYQKKGLKSKFVWNGK